MGWGEMWREPFPGSMPQTLAPLTAAVGAWCKGGGGGQLHRESVGGVGPASFLQETQVGAQGEVHSTSHH